MSVREYIGARYIPLFPDDPQWSSANTYEPLTVVQNLGSSYISRQYVPAGIQLSNTDYWVLWADFNSQIEQYRSEVQAFDGRITANADAIAAETRARETAVTGLEGDISAETTARKAADTALESRIETLESELWVVIGDSFSDHTQGGAAITDWLEVVASLRPEITIKDFAAGGAGYARQPAIAFPAQISQAINDTTFANTDVTRVIVYGGINDARNNEALQSVQDAARNAALLIRGNFPNAQADFCYNWTADTFFNSTTQRYIAYTAAGLNAVGYQLNLDSAFLLFNYKYADAFQTDRIHPNNHGHRIIAAYMLDNMSGSYRNRVIGPLTAANVKTVQTPTIGSQNPNAQLEVVNEPMDAVSYAGGKWNFTVPYRTYKVTNLSNDEVIFSFPINPDFPYYANMVGVPLSAVVSVTRGYTLTNVRAWLASNTIYVASKKTNTAAWPTDEQGVNFLIGLNAEIQLI